MTKKISAEVLAVLKKGTIETNIFYLPPEQLERSLYQEVNKVLELLGGKWNRSAKGHVFADDPGDEIESAVLSGEVIDKKKLYQFFETPKDLVHRMIEAAEIPYSEDPLFMPDVLEPSAGHGAIADEIDASRSMFRCCELDPDKAKILMDKGHAVFCGDFLTEIPEQFDRIIMNPPFAKQQDIDHVTKAFEILRPGGRIVAVMSPGFTFRENRKSLEFRDLVTRYGHYTDLPEGTFKDSGTIIRTVLVVLDKPL